MPLTDGLKAAYKYEDENWLDSSGNGYTQTPHGTPTVALDEVTLDGATDYLTKSDVADLRGGDRDFSIFVKLTPGTVTGTFPIIAKQGEYALYQSGANAYFCVRRLGDTHDDPTAAVPITSGTPIGLLCVYNSTSNVVHLHDVSDCPTAHDGGGVAETNGTTANPLEIGHQSGSNLAVNYTSQFYTGTIDTFLFWDRALSDEECSDLYLGGGFWEPGSDDGSGVAHLVAKSLASAIQGSI